MPYRDVFRHDGLRIPVHIWEARTEPLLFLPGMGVHPCWYAEGLERLSRHRALVVPDLSFRTHETLPEGVLSYLELVEALADRYAPGAPRAGHSFGGLLALLGSRPALALSPTIPLRVGWATKIGRAVLLQLREYVGLEGRRGVRWAAGILADYVRTALTSPRCLFPAISETLSGLAGFLRPAAPRGRVVLATYDRLYRLAESLAFLGAASAARIEVRRVRRGHDWPVTHPRLLEVHVRRGLRALERRVTPAGV